MQLGLIAGNGRFPFLMLEAACAQKHKVTIVAAKEEGSPDLSKAAAGRTLDALLSAISGALSGGGTVTITGFGTFSVSNRAARMGRNPQTGEALHIAASKSPKFKAGKALKDAVN